MGGGSDLPDASALPLHPAKELADIRRQIARLRKREAELRSEVLSCTTDSPLASALNGPHHRVVIKTTRAKRFDKDLLPQVIRSDPRFFATREQIRVCVLPTDRPAHRHAHPRGVFSNNGTSTRSDDHLAENGEIEVLEPFSAALHGG